MRPLIYAACGALAVVALAITPSLGAGPAASARSRATATPTETPTTTPTAAPTATSAPTATPLGDALEDNYSPQTAARVAWDTPLELSIRCPAAGACTSGDHDLVLVPTKAGVPLLAATFGLATGTDTTITLFGPAPGFTDPATGFVGWRALTGNDDAAPGVLRSEVRLTPDWSGDALLVVASADRRDPPQGATGGYKLIVGNPASAAVRAALGTELLSIPTQPPVLTVPPVAVTSPVAVPAAPPQPAAKSHAADEEEIIRERCAAGMASVRSEQSRFYAAAPGRPDRLLASYERGATVQLLGSCYLGWVKTLPEGAVTPGWMFAPELGLTAPSASTPGASAASGAEPPSATPTAATLRVVPLPRATAPAATVLPLQPLTVTIRVQDDRKRPLGGARVQLLDGLDSVLAEGIVPANGALTLTIAVRPGVALRALLPALGIGAAVDSTRPELTVTVPA